SLCPTTRRDGGRKAQALGPSFCTNSYGYCQRETRLRRPEPLQSLSERLSHDGGCAGSRSSVRRRASGDDLRARGRLKCRQVRARPVVRIASGLWENDSLAWLTDWSWDDL